VLVALGTAISLILPATAAFAADPDSHDTAAGRHVGYFTQWGIYDRGYLVKNVVDSGQIDHLTHLNYAFGNTNEQGQCFEANQAGVGDAWADYQRRFTADQSVDGQADAYDQPLAGNFNQLKKLKAAHPDLKIMFSLGGWTWSKYLSNAALPENRANYVKSCIDMFIKGNLPKIGGEPQGGDGAAAGIFDGFDIDWEWPASEGNTGNVFRPEDKANYVALLEEFRKQLDAVGSGYELSIYGAADPDKIAAGFDVPNLMKSVDFVNVQGYDLNGAWDATTNHQAQIHSPDADPNPKKWSADLAIQSWKDAGAPADKLVLGLPAFGRGWTGVPNTDNGLYQTSTGAAPGKYEAGIDDYKLVKDKPGTVYRDEDNMAVWKYDGSNFWSYDDADMIRKKMAWVAEQGLGGSMIWSLDGDDGSLVAAMDS
jgi:chitinase